MVVLRGEHVAYDEKFHDGVNIVRGENSSGKSTVLNLIHYGLGGDVSEWSETARLCEQVMLEVRLSGKVVTLSRWLSEKSQESMDFFFGTYEESKRALRSQWNRFPYRRSQGKESFSQVLFRLLDIPEAANEDSGNITIHQVLRLLYADQLSPVDEIFAHEGFDNANIREAVGKLLCGAFDNELYINGLDTRAEEKRFAAISGELSSLYRALGQAGHDLTIGWIIEQRARNETERESVTAEISRLQRDASPESRNPTLEAQETAYESLVNSQQELASLRTDRDSLALAIVDSSSFIRSLDEKLVALKDASLVAQEVGLGHFSACPVCYSELAQAVEGHCALCKEPVDSEAVLERIGGLINETALQLRQSRLLQEGREESLAELASALTVTESEWQTAARRYSEVQRRPTNEQELRLSEMYKRLGYLERQDEDLTEKSKLIEIIDALSTQKRSLNDSLARLRNRNEQLVYSQQVRLKDAYHSISDNVRSLLSLDLARQDSFENPQKVDFSFSDNKITVDGHTYFSASSRAILRSAFFLGLHASSTQKEYFRHPRFVMLDTIEDKGMEATRSQNFQKLIVAVVEKSPTDCQVIFGTAMISPDLDTEEYVVGRSYTRERRSLNIGIGTN